MTTNGKLNLVYQIIRQWPLIYSHPPSYQNIADAARLSGRGHAKYYVDQLERTGRITRKPRSPRTVRVVEEP